MIALGCDHGGYELKQEIKKYLDEKGIEYKDYGEDTITLDNNELTLPSYSMALIAVE